MLSAAIVIASLYSQTGAIIWHSSVAISEFQNREIAIGLAHDMIQRRYIRCIGLRALHSMRLCAVSCFRQDKTTSRLAWGKCSCFGPVYKLNLINRFLMNECFKWRLNVHDAIFIDFR